MQVASNTTTDKQTSLERQVQSKERPTAINTKASAVKSEEKATAAKAKIDFFIINNYFFDLNFPGIVYFT